MIAFYLFIQGHGAGENLVGSEGKLYSVYDLKHDVLEYNPSRVIATLDVRGRIKEDPMLR